MPWRETCAMDERMRFVLSCEAGEESFSALCRGYGVSRRSGYKWLERYRAAGPVGLVDRSRAPHAHPNGTAEALCERVICIRLDQIRQAAMAGVSSPSVDIEYQSEE